ncbi:phosphatase PAP2 family protein [Natronococcus sp. A-GB1]|uniref:phosphatase PAP2 family protein n=1 Tax=Natronococcus sp. A-GB1 TaxID=3037648 RepID=UPI00241E396D|nr:phosphatase PAP2 family protein [Natronococcus sp. A-GB1]MDG5758698.1 phosphatase PAP2 family protein [Natronococcus sp. A-GB1]
MWFESARVEAVRDAFPEWLAFLVAFLSHLGSVWFVAPAVVLAFWYLDPRRFASWIGIVLGCYAVMIGLKGFFETPRPGVDPAVAVESLPLPVALVYAPAVEISTSSFPSGHAMAAVVIWTMLALELDVGTRRQRIATAAAMIGLVSLSRVVVGVHFPIDVVVGTLVGLGYVAAMLAIRRRMRTRGRHAATTAVFVTSVVLASLALVTDGRADTAALLGGSVGGALAWRYAPPPRESWDRTLRGALPAVLGSSLLGGIALTLLVVDSHLVWFLVGLIGGAVVVGLPAFAATRSPVATFRQPAN